MRTTDHLVRIELRAEHGDEPRCGRTIGNLAGGDGQPPLDGCGAAGIFRQPISAPCLLGEIDEDCVRVRDDHAVIFQHRHLAEWIEREKLRTLVRAALKVDFDLLVRNVEQRSEHSAVRVARQWVMVKLHGEILLDGRVHSRSAVPLCFDTEPGRTLRLGTSLLRKM
jgi:hypothetical protein